MPGWREGIGSPDLRSSERLCSNVTYEQLETLARVAGLRAYFPYAVGAAPWCRIADARDPLHPPVSSLGMELEEIESRLSALEAAPRLLPARYGVPIDLI